MNRKPYPEYKESGVQWLAQVPGHWGVKRLKFAFPKLYSGVSVNSESSPADQESVGVMKTSCVYGNQFIPTENKRVVDEEIERVACPVTADSLIVSRMNTPELVGNCGYVESDYPNLFLPDRLWIARFSRCRGLYGKYAWYFCISDGIGKLTGALATGTSGSMKNLSQDAFLNIDAIVPPLPEQTAIADFLDRETGRIDTLVAKKRRLIALLGEKRTALISRTVTRGLPADAAREFGLEPHTCFKDSGIEWLDEVPEGWEPTRLKFIADIQTGYAFSSDDFTDEGVPVLRIGDITKDGSVDFANAKYLPENHKTVYSKVLITRGAIVMAMTGATIGKAGKYDQDAPALLNQRVCSFYSTGDNDQNFLWYILNADFYIEHINLTAFGGAQPNISDTELLDCFVAVAPATEQAAIATYLDRETAKIDRLMEKIETAIARLQEYRTALITAAVTGKIDVREEVA